MSLLMSLDLCYFYYTPNNNVNSRVFFIEYEHKIHFGVVVSIVKILFCKILHNTTVYKYNSIHIHVRTLTALYDI